MQLTTEVPAAHNLTMSHEKLYRFCVLSDLLAQVQASAHLTSTQLPLMGVKLTPALFFEMFNRKVVSLKVVSFANSVNLCTCGVEPRSPRLGD